MPDSKKGDPINGAQRRICHQSYKAPGQKRKIEYCAQLGQSAGSNEILKTVRDSPELCSRLENLLQAEKENEMRINGHHRSRDKVLNSILELAKSYPPRKSKAAADLAFLRMTPEKLLKRIEGR